MPKACLEKYRRAALDEVMLKKERLLAKNPRAFKFMDEEAWTDLELRSALQHWEKLLAKGEEPEVPDPLPHPCELPAGARPLSNELPDFPRQQDLMRIAAAGKRDPGMELGKLRAARYKRAGVKVPRARY